jgi:hypothetical protein
LSLIRHGKVDAKSGMPFHELWQAGNDFPHGEARRDANAQHASQFTRSARSVIGLL